MSRFPALPTAQSKCNNVTRHLTRQRVRVLHTWRAAVKFRRQSWIQSFGFSPKYIRDRRRAKTRELWDYQPGFDRFIDVKTFEREWSGNVGGVLLDSAVKEEEAGTHFDG